MNTILVRGAGISGVTTAYSLLKKGFKVVLTDPHGIAERCSRANGGQMSTSNCETWTSYDNIGKAIKMMYNDEKSFQIRPDVMSFQKAKWFYGFLGSTILNKQFSNSSELIRIAMESRNMVENILDEIEIDINKRKGILHLYRNSYDFKKAIETCKKYEFTRWGRRPVDINEIIKIEPNIKHDGIVGGTMTDMDWSGDVHSFCIQLVNYMKLNYDLKFTMNKCDDREYNSIVYCVGCQTPNYFPSTVYPVKGYSVTYNNTNVIKDKYPSISILDDSSKIVTSTYDSSFRVAGLMELAGYDTSIKPENIDVLTHWVKTNTFINNEQNHQWACLRPMTSNMMPSIKQYGNIVVNSGGGHLGWTLSMALAEKAALLVESNLNK